MTVLTKDNCASSEDVVEVINPLAPGKFLLVCEHASRFIPSEFDNLGLDEEVLKSHVAWGPGAYAVACMMTDQLGSPLVAQRISRLVYDCNRPPTSPGAMPEKSEIFDIPGNVGLTQSQRQSRVDAFYLPFHQAVSDQIDKQIENQLPPVLLTMHSFTPVYHGAKREVEIGILHDSDARFADELLESLKSETSFIVRRNEPYGPKDGVTHTLLKHALPHGLMNIMIEIRNDLIVTTDAQVKMAELLSHHMNAVVAKLSAESTP